MKNQLNNAQQKAVDHFKGPALVLAGPGSGKTLVIVHRIRKLIEHYSVPPENILVVTFSRAAAHEMQERFYQLVKSPAASKVTFGTFHSIFFRILKLAYNYDPKNIISESEKYNIIRDIVEQYSLEYTDEAELFGKIINEIGIIKSSFAEPGDFISSALPPNTFRNVFKSYENEMRRRNLIDFDDMLSLCYELLSKREDILRFWQKKFQFILIDEFQDINHIQYETIKMIANRYGNIFVVGDDDQSIYGFRGADPGIMQTFLHDYKNAEEILLNVNYRCRDKILSKAMQLISVNTDRIDKRIKAYKKSYDGKHVINIVNYKFKEDAQYSSYTAENSIDETVSITAYRSQDEEYEAICDQILRMKNTGQDINDTAVLFRSSFDANLLLQKFTQKNIPFTVKEKPQNLFRHFIALDVIAYMKCASGITRKDILRICNKPLRYISRAAIEAMERTSMLEFYRDKEYMHDRLIKFDHDLKEIRSQAPFAAIKYIRHAVGYEEYLKKYAGENHVDFSEYEMILDFLEESAKPYNYKEQWFDFIEEYSANISENKISDEMIKGIGNKKIDESGNIVESTGITGKKGVQVMTMHASKGLEFDTVFIPCLNYEFVPHRKAVEKTEIKEERRLLYVAMTRAKEHLHLSYADEIRHKHFAPSEFLENIL